MGIFDCRSIMERMKEVKKLKSDRELSEILEVSVPTLSSWKTRNSLPPHVILDFAHNNQVDLNWLFTGENNQPQLTTAESMALTAFNALDEGKKIDAISYMAGLNGGNRPALTQTIHGNASNVAGGDISIQK